MFRDQLRTALLVAWLVVTAVLVPVLLAPFLLSAERIAAITPACEWKVKYQRDCPACGMTTAFILISEGKWGEAERHNRAAVPLFVLFALDVSAGGCFVASRLRRKPHRRLWAGTVEMRTEELSCKS